MAGLFDFLTGGSGGGLLGLGPRQSSALDPDYYLQRAQPSMGLLEGGGLMGGLRGALQALGDPGGKRQQQALQNYIILKEMQNKEAASKQFGEGLSGYLGGGQQPAAPSAWDNQGGGGQFAPAIAGIESGGRYDAKGPVLTQGQYKGDRAYGKYQVLGVNIGPWTQEVLGRPMTPEEFVATPAAQDAVFKAKFGQLAQKYGPEGASRAWFAGEGGMNNPNRTDQLGTSVAAYGQKFSQNMAGLPPQMIDMPQAGAPASGLPSQVAGMPAGVMSAQAPQMPQAPQGQPQQGMSPKVMGLINMLKNPYLDAGQRKLGETLLAQELDQSKRTDDIREFEYAKRQGFTGTLEQWIQRKRSGAGEYGLQPIWGTDPATGEPAIIQLGKGGEAVRSKIPDNIKVGKDVIRIDAGTHTILLDPVTRQPIGQVSKNIEQTQAAEKRGAAQGEAQVNLGGVVNQADLALKTIEQIRSHPGKSFGTGVTGILPGIPGTNQRGFVALVDQAKGQTFLTAFERLKGAGAITETEGLKATQAIGRLDRAQSAADFETALKDLESVIKVGVERAKQKAGAAPDAGGWTEINGVRIREKR